MESSVDIAKKLAEALNWKLIQVEDVFEIDEDKQGFFVLTLKPKKFLDPADFRIVCTLSRDLGGDGEYAKATRSWKVPGVLAKKTPQSVPTSVPTKKLGFEFLPLASLVSMPFTSRTDVEDPELIELAESIRLHGVLEPLIVREKGGFYEVVMGERRKKACRIAGLTEIPAIVKVLSDEEAYTLQLIENVQRKDLSDLEKAHALDRMIKTFGYTQEALGKKLGKTQVWVSQRLAMLQIPESITRVIKHGEFTEKQAREILAASPEKREEILDEITKTGEVPSSRELHAVAHPSVKCDHCGEPVEHPVHVEGKFYHDECAEQVKAEKEPSLVPGEPTPSFDVSEENVETEETSDQIRPKKEPEKGLVKPEPLLTGYSWTCPDCGAKLIINHVDWPGSKTVEHRLEFCGT